MRSLKSAALRSFYRHSRLPPPQHRPEHAYTKSDEGFARVLNVLPTPQAPKWVIRCIWVVLFAGAVAILYTIAELLQRLAR